MTTVIAVTNQKGGVGKTTTAVTLSSYLAQFGFRTLLVDFDPQGNATSGLGVEIREEGQDLFDMFFGRVTLRDVLRPSAVKGLDVAPSSKDLVGVEIELGKTAGRELILKTQLQLLKSRYDFILIDCPPSSGLLSLNALGAAHSVIIPMQAEYYALEGLSALMETISFVQDTFNPGLDILGVFVTMYDGRTNLSRQVLEEVRGHFGEKSFEAVIPRSVRLSECPSHGLPISLYDPESTGARAYEKLAREVVERTGEGEILSHSPRGKVANS
ncbi:ParA family protein [bacterium]|nr:ParA family protein [bacterium]